MPNIVGKSQRGFDPGAKPPPTQKNCILAPMSRYISETGRDRAIVTIEHEYQVAHALSISVVSAIFPLPVTALRASGCNFSRFRGRTRVLTLWDVCGVHGDVKFVAILLFPVHVDTGSGFISQKRDEIEP